MYEFSLKYNLVSPNNYNISQEIKLSTQETLKELVKAIFYKIGELFSNAYNEQFSTSWKLFKGEKWEATINEEFLTSHVPTNGMLYNPKVVAEHLASLHLFQKVPEETPSEPPVPPVTEDVVEEPKPPTPPPAPVVEEEPKPPAPAPAPVVEVPTPPAPEPAKSEFAFNFNSQKKCANSGIFQLPVLLQLLDETGFGAQTCGYHSLKNALIALNCFKIGNENENLFTDLKLFKKFFETYCLPMVIDKPANDKDANPSMVRIILTHFKNDPNPPEELKGLQKTLREAPEFAICILNTANTNNALSLTLNEYGIKEALKFYQFAKTPGPSRMALVVSEEMIIPGKANRGHWYTIICTKNQNNEITIHICDSLNNAHDKLKGPLLLLTNFFNHQLKNPDLFIKTAFESHLGPYLKNTVKRTETKGNLEAVIQALLDPTGNAFLAEEGFTDGSPRQTFINCLKQSFFVMKEAGWLRSFEKDRRAHVDNLLKLAQFCLKYVDDESQILILAEIEQSIIDEKKKEIELIRRKREESLHKEE